jgi:hypothetical protein
MYIAEKKATMANRNPSVEAQKLVRGSKPHLLKELPRWPVLDHDLDVFHLLSEESRNPLQARKDRLFELFPPQLHGSPREMGSSPYFCNSGTIFSK